MDSPVMKERCNTFVFWIRLVLDTVWVSICLIPALLRETYHLVIPRRRKDIRGKIALVTGTAQGLGRELALELARKGCTVICVDVNTEANKSTAEELKRLGYKSHAYTCDVGNSDQVAELASKVGPVDILVNNAGIIVFGPFLETPQRTIRKVIDVNITAQFLMLQAFLPGMLKRDSGHIVATASCAGLIPLTNAALYSSTKYAVVGLMSSLTQELRLQNRNNIKTSCVCPYFIRTIKEIDTCVDARIPAIEAKDAAYQIVRGIRQELTLFAVPLYFERLFNIQRLFPVCIQDKFRDTLYTRVNGTLFNRSESNSSKE